jgi:hypothetical protein
LTGIGDFLSRQLDDSAKGVITFEVGSKSNIAPAAIEDLTRKDYVDNKDNNIQANLNAHVADTANPHSVTAAQAGADPVGSAAAVQANLDTHEADFSNPHQRLVGWEVFAGLSPDLYPIADDVFIGNAENPVRGVAVGRVTGDPASPGIEGLVASREMVSPGEPGIVIAGYKLEDLSNPPAEPNAPVSIYGSANYLMGSNFVESDSPITEDHYLAVGPTVQLASGQYVAPLLRGPRIVYSATDTNSSALDVDLDDAGGEVLIVSMTIANGPYPSADSTFTYRIQLQENGERDTLFTVSFYRNSVFAGEFNTSLNGSSQLFTDTLPLGVQWENGDLIEMRASSVGTNPLSDGWVRGATNPSTITVSKG